MPRLRPLSFAAGMTALFLAMVWPLHGLAETWFAGHMAQHMVLMDAAAPLLVMALPAGSAPARLRRLGRWLTVPALTALVHGIVLWGWHVPTIYRVAVSDPMAHAAMHLTFLAAGLMFWGALARAARDEAAASLGAAIVWTFLTLMHAGLLGALITFAPQPLYGAPLADQQLAGLIMWIPTGTVYLVAGVALAAIWLRRLEQRYRPETP